MAVSKNIKGITIEFNGDTTKLGKALEGIRKDARGVDAQLKQVNSALKFNPKNTELLAQKQQLLGQKVDLTKKRLDALREAQAKMDADPSVDKTSQDYTELRREIIVTESQLKNFTKQLKEVENVKFKQVGEQFQKVGGKIESVGKGMSKYVTTPIVGGAAASVAAWKEVDEGLDIIVQKTGASGKALEGMQDSAKTLAQTIPVSFEEAGSAIGEVNTRFGVTGKELEDLSGQFLKFAQLNGTDVSTSIDQVQKAMAAFGVPAEEAGGMLDVLNKVGQDTGVSMDTLTQSLVTNAPALQAMGFTANQAATFLGQLEVSGVDSSKVMTGLQKALVNGAKAGKTMPEVMQEIQQSIVGASSETEAMNAATELFGAKAGPAIATAARSGALDFQSLASAITDAEGSLDSTFENTLDPADKFTLALNSLKVTGYEIADTVFKYLNPALEKLSGWLRDLAAKWETLSPQTQKAILVAAGIAAALGPVLIFIGKVATGIGSIITLIPKLGAAFTFLTGPVGIVIAAIAAAIAIGVLLYKHWDTIKQKASEVWGAIKNIFITALDAIKNIFITAWNGIVEFFTGAVKGLADMIKRAWNGITDFFRKSIEGWRLLFVAVWNKIKEIFITAAQAIKEAVIIAWGAIKNVFVGIWNGIVTAVTTVWNLYKRFLTAEFNGIKTIVKTVFGWIAKWLDMTWGNLFRGTKKVWDNIKSAMVTPIEKARDAIKKIIEKIKGFFDFDFKLPDLKTPHFSIDPPGWSIGDLLHGVIPDLNVDWYAKGGIFRSPSIIGVGEAGAEAVLPIDRLQGMLAGMADSIVNGILMGGQLQQAGAGGEIKIVNYLYPSGPQLGETVVRTYDQYKKILG